MVVLPTRRVLIVIALAATILILLYQLHDSALPRWRNTVPPSASAPQTTSPLQKPEIDVTNSFWKSRATHYPLDSLTPVPTSKPQQLPPIQHSFSPESTQDAELRLSRQQQVKEAFQEMLALLPGTSVVARRASAHIGRG